MIEKTRPYVFLIAEDEDSNFVVLKLLLKKNFDAEILHAFNGEEAYNFVINRPDIDLVFMDIKMPVMDGYIATGLIKEKYPKLPVIAITAYGLTGDEHKALHAGCDDYVSKPIHIPWMLSKVRRLLNIQE